MLPEALVNNLVRPHKKSYTTGGLKGKSSGSANLKPNVPPLYGLSDYTYQISIQELMEGVKVNALPP